MRSTSYGTRRKTALPASRSSTRYAARASPSRGWPTEPGFRSARSTWTRSTTVLGGRDVAVDRAARERELERDVAVADEHELLGRREHRRRRDLLREDVLPDRVARARVVEADSGSLAGRLERAEKGLGLGVERRGCPARARRRVRCEEVEVDLAEDAEIVVSDQADVGALGDEAAARVRARAVPYEVPEAPELVRPLAGDRVEDGLEGMQVSMDVRDDAGSHRGRATLAKSAAALLAGAAWLGCALFLARTTVPALDLPDLDPARYFSEAELARADRFRAVTRALWGASLVLELAVLALLAWRGRGLAERVRTVARGRVRTGVVLGLVAVALTALATLPLALTRHWWNRRYGLSEQAYASWAGDWALSVAIRAVLVSLAVAGVVWLAGRLGSRWWLAAAPALAALAVGFVLVQPLVVQPLFNRFEPLPDETLERGGAKARGRDRRGGRDRPGRRREPADDDRERVRRRHRADATRRLLRHDPRRALLAGRARLGRRARARARRAAATSGRASPGSCSSPSPGSRSWPG